LLDEDSWGCEIAKRHPMIMAWRAGFAP
jgi:hypothetical protein